ncbi:E3 ubiquitin-protein ligase RING2-A-like [Platysternon megacephalum]|uniref:E3 ubiquitin-protein ligase RING2-A-like n=1 Tax=Platysternon megacephalum TaxID=55544 RepID=A0A4D9DQU3_9SAUR|nr:E3 ubiquitin-protein ligase RING2-A-like [Platysternon megacephalum]
MTKATGTKDYKRLSVEINMEETLEKATNEAKMTNEDICCKALATALCHITPPVTIGLYAPWGCRKKMLLDRIQEYMTPKREEKTKKHKLPGCFLLATDRLVRLIRLFCIVIRMVFFIPVRKKPQADDTCYIFINFSAWEYVGSDHTWAGLVTTLCDEIEKRYRILMSVFRVFGSEVKDETPQKSENKWVMKSYMKCLLWCTFLLIVIFFLICLETSSRYKIVNILIPTGSAITIYVTGIGLPVLKNVIFTLKSKLAKEMSRKDFSSQLGFMHNVKIEVEVITNFLQFMAFYKQKEICVVLKVTNLDICTPDKVEIGNEYMPGNNIQMKRIVNTVINIRLMINMGFQTEVETENNFEVLVNWVILANNWPCRLSWILQCVEDDWQRNQLNETNVGSQEDADLLLDIYNNNSSELDKIKPKIEKLLELDGDPDLFINFLKTKKFTVKHVKQFSNLTINLDSSLKRRLELIRSMNGITSDKLNQTIPHELCDECQ